MPFLLDVLAYLVQLFQLVLMVSSTWVVLKNSIRNKELYKYYQTFALNSGLLHCFLVCLYLRILGIPNYLYLALSMTFLTIRLTLLSLFLINSCLGLVLDLLVCCTGVTILYLIAA